MGVRKQKAVLVLCCLLMFLSGCEGAALLGTCVGASYLGYSGEHVKRDYNAPLTEVWNACLSTCDELEVKAETEEPGSSGRLIKGEMPDGKKFAIRLEKETATSTKVTIRTVPFANRKISESIHDRIASKLQEQQPHL